MLINYLKSSRRGADRLAGLLAQNFKRFQLMPVTLNGGSPVYIDLRSAAARHYFHSDLSQWERGPRAVMKHYVKPGMVSYDIGANMGFHTAGLSRLVGPNGAVIAFEPNPALLGGLRHTCQQAGNAKLLPIGLSNNEGDLDFFIPADHTMASLHDWTSLPSEKILVPVRRLDSLDLPLPQFIKCDVEGFEFEVFQGAKNLLQKARPIILFESYSQNSGDHLAAPKLLQSLGYTLHKVSDCGDLELLTSFDYVAADLLAV